MLTKCFITEYLKHILSTDVSGTNVTKLLTKEEDAISSDGAWVINNQDIF